VLEAAGVVADVVVGASIGSVFGLAYAAGVSAERIAAMVAEAPRWAAVHFYGNHLRIDRSTYIGSLLYDIAQNRYIEDLPRAFACMAVDVDSGEVVALRRGPILPAIEASIALPWIARPVEIEGRRYIDGGLRGSIPAAVARSMGADYVISVELSRKRLLDHLPVWCQRAQTTILRWCVGGKLQRSAGEDVSPPSGIEISSLSTDVKPDLEIRPSFYGLSANAPVGIRFCMRRGEVAARTILPRLLAQLL
jgi:predicted acylesterase/phospholipase RssA